MSFCTNDLRLENFKDANMSIEFCLRVNNIFDIPNTKNILSKNKYNRSINNITKTEIYQHIDESIEYLTKIRCNEKLLKSGQR